MTRVPTAERLEWLHEQLGNRMSEKPLAGEVFRPRGAWGDRTMRFRRLLFRLLGVGSGLHSLERRMGLLNLAVATPTRLVLFRLRGSWGSIDVEREIASWPRCELAVGFKHGRVEAEHFSPGGFGTLTSHMSSILVVRLQPPSGPVLEIDVAATRDGSALMALL